MLFALFAIMVMGLASAEETDYQKFKLNEAGNLVFLCQNSAGTPCNSSILCNITILNQGNNFILVNQSTTNRNGDYYFYPLTKQQNGVQGYYTFVAKCSDSSGITGQVSGTYKVTPFAFGNVLNFYLVFLIIIVLVFIFAFVIENEYVVMLGSTLLLLFGFFIIRYGIDFVKDNSLTWAIGLSIWGLGIYTMYLSIEEQLKEWD
jgi:hypothetical protein